MTYPPNSPGPYGQQPPWVSGPQGGFPVGPPPSKPRTGLITSLIIVAILVVGGGGVGTYLLLTKSDEDNGSGTGGGEGRGARGAAQTYVRELENALNTDLQDVDLSPLEPVTCGDDFGKMEDEIKDAKDSDESSSATPGNEHKVRIRMKDFEQTSDGATFTMTQKSVGDNDAQGKDMTVAKEDGDWKVCGIYDEGEHVPGGSNQQDPPGGGSTHSGEAPPNPIPTT